MYPKLMDVLRYARKIGYHESILYTNASLITPRLAIDIKEEVDTIGVHVDAIDPRVFECIHYDKNPRVVRQLHRSILRGVQSLLDAGFSGEDVRLTLTLCRPLLGGLERLFDWAFNEVGLQTSMFIPVAPFGRGATIPRSWFPSRDEIRDAYEVRARYERRPYLMQLGVAEYCKQYQMTMCYVPTDGSITPYAGSSSVCGSIASSSLLSIVDGAYPTIAFRDCSDGIRNLDGCKPCSTCRNSRYCFGNPVCREAASASTSVCEPMWCYQMIGNDV